VGPVAAVPVTNQDLRMVRAFGKDSVILLILVFAAAVYGEEKVSFRTNIFSDNSGTTVESPAIEIVKDIYGKLEFFVRYSLDRVNIPPIGIGRVSAEPISAVTGASRPASSDEPADRYFTKKRNEVTAGLGVGILNASYYHSDEVDYVGRMATISSNFDFNKRNSNLAISYSYGWDTVKPIGQSDIYEKEAHTGNFTLTQALTPSLIGRIGADVSYVTGFQSNPYRIVSVFEGEQLPVERHPLERSRGGAFVKLNRYFKSRAVLNLEYRYYQDDWEVKSHTASVFLYQYFSDKVLFRYRYRYYDQSEAYFYKDRYIGDEAFLTSDYKLESFNAHLFGFKLEYRLNDLLKDGFLRFLAASTFEAKYERYFASNDFTADIFQFGLVVNY
jgi:hypothetical protein